MAKIQTTGSFPLKEIPSERVVTFVIFSHAMNSQNIDLQKHDGKSIKFKTKSSTGEFPVTVPSAKQADVRIIVTGWFKSPKKNDEKKDHMKVVFNKNDKKCTYYPIQQKFQEGKPDRGGIYAFGVSDGGSGFKSDANITLLIRWEGPPLGESPGV